MQAKVRQCADLIKVSGDVFVTLCNRDRMLRVYDMASMQLLQQANLTKFGSDLKRLGNSGFEIIQIGNSYNIFFTAVETVLTKVLVVAPESPNATP